MSNRLTPRLHASVVVVFWMMAPSGCHEPTTESGTPKKSAARPADSFRGPSPEAVSRLGRPLLAPAPGSNPDQEAKLLAAREGLAANPDDPEALVWVGRRHGYLLQVRRAIAVYSEGLGRFPEYAPLFRHRGHRYITARQFDKAEADLLRAAELIRGKPDRVEPDGMPNARNIPLTTTAFNVWYHLGLARYLQGDFAGAAEAHTQNLAHSRRYDDNLVATTYWSYLSLRRLGRDGAARELLSPVTPDMTIIENDAYHRLCLLYKGEIGPDRVAAADDETALNNATLGYGLGMHHLLNGRRDEAIGVFERIVETDQWAAFGFIAAEVELARLRSEG